MKILVTTDLSDDMAPVMKYAAQLAKKLDSKMYMLHLVAPCTIDTPDYVPHGEMLGKTADAPLVSRTCDDQALSLCDTRTKELGLELSQQWGVDIYAKAEESTDIVTSVHEFSERHNIDMVVVGRRHHSALGEFLLGSTSTKLMRQSPIPILVVPTES